jgi:hypothetical protein
MQTRARVIFVKSVDGSPPDPTFERVMTYTFGNDPKEYRVRIHGGDSPAIIREGPKRLHPGKNLATMIFDNAEMDDGDPVGDWLSRTGTSHFRVNWRMEKETQKFWLCTQDGEKDLGNEELEDRDQTEVW